MTYVLRSNSLKKRESRKFYSKVTVEIRPEVIKTILKSTVRIVIKKHTSYIEKKKKVLNFLNEY